MTAPVDRRSFLRKSSLMASAALIAPSLTGLVSCSDPVEPFDTNGMRAALNRGIGGGYGALEPVKKYPEISIPRGFHAERLSVRGDMMDDGLRVPQALDGMGAFAMGGNIVRLVRNHRSVTRRAMPGLSRAIRTMQRDRPVRPRSRSSCAQTAPRRCVGSSQA
jgi:secreted PhoX family phosphatase